MEQGIVETLERQIGHMDELPEARQKMTEHLEQTKQHAEKIKTCITNLGGDVSTLKSTMANIMGAMDGMTKGLAGDKMVKDALALFATENFEIASYTSLIAAAKHCGEEDVVKICESILQEERIMATWAEGQIPQITTHYLDMQNE